MRAEGIEAVRRILCVFPRYTSAFGTFEHAQKIHVDAQLRTLHGTVGPVGPSLEQSIAPLE